MDTTTRLAVVTILPISDTNVGIMVWWEWTSDSTPMVVDVVEPGAPGTRKIFGGEGIKSVDRPPPMAKSEDTGITD